MGILVGVGQLGSASWGIADIVSGGGKSIVIHFEEPSDLFAVGSLHGYGVNGAHYGSHVQLPTETSVLPARIGIRVVPQ